jgi:hypothetical protein
VKFLLQVVMARWLENDAALRHKARPINGSQSFPESISHDHRLRRIAAHRR